MYLNKLLIKISSCDLLAMKTVYSSFLKQSIVNFKLTTGKYFHRYHDKKYIQPTLKWKNVT